jgi:hypothetical protein
MKIVQKITFIGTLVLAGLYFIYALSFSTGWALGGDGFLGDFFYHAQDANKIIYQYGLILVLLAGGNMILNSHSNHNFYIPNFILAVGTAICMVLTAIITFQLMPPLKAEYMTLNGYLLEDFGLLDLLTTINLAKISTRVFDLGVLLAGILLFFAVLILFVTGFQVVKQLELAHENKSRRVDSSYNRSVRESNTDHDQQTSSDKHSVKEVRP